MTTVREIVTDAYREIDVVALEEFPTAAEAQDGLTKLKRMLSSWAIDSLVVFSRTAYVFPLTAGQGVYTLGTGAMFNIPSPAKIEQAFIRSPQGYDYPVLVSNDYTDYSSITVKAITTNLPIFLYNDNKAPNQNLYLWPVPSDGVNSLVLWVSDVIGAYTTLDDVITLPDGYEEAIVSNLAIRLAPGNGVSVTPELALIATDSKALLMQMNYQAQILQVDPGLTGDGIYNIITDKPVGWVN